MEVAGLHPLIDDKADVEDKNPTLLGAVEMYLQLKAQHLSVPLDETVDM